jgi:hypothetical protein
MVNPFQTQHGHLHLRDSAHQTYLG